MTSKRAKREAMMFDYGSTYRTNYHGDPFDKHAPVTLVYNRPQKPRPKAELTKFNHTLSQFKTEIPFSIWHKPKEIIRTTPHIDINPRTKVIDAKLEDEVRRTRPRVFITPAVSVDDIEDPSTRDFLMKNTYTSANYEAYKDAVPEATSQAILPLPGYLMPANPLKLPKGYQLYVSPEWRMDSASWDRRQLRGHDNTTERFWLNHPVSPCRACDESALVMAQRRAVNN